MHTNWWFYSIEVCWLQRRDWNWGIINVISGLMTFMSHNVRWKRGQRFKTMASFKNDINGFPIPNTEHTKTKEIVRRLMAERTLRSVWFSLSWHWMAVCTSPILVHPPLTLIVRDMCCISGCSQDKHKHLWAIRRAVTDLLTSVHAFSNFVPLNWTGVSCHFQKTTCGFHSMHRKPLTFITFFRLWAN